MTTILRVSTVYSSAPASTGPSVGALAPERPGDPASPYTQRVVEPQPTQVAMAEVPAHGTPLVHYTVRVMGKRVTG